MADVIPNPFDRVANADGVPRLCERKCSSCLYLPGAMNNGMREVIDDARRRNSFVMCHETYPHSTFTPAPDVQPAMCRGYWDANKGTQYGLSILDENDLYEEVPAPPPDEDQRAYRMASTNDDRFTVFRVHD